MRRLFGAIRNYAWGSHTALAELTGRPVPTEHPEAELWYGAHPQESSHCDDAAGPLLEAEIAADPAGQLGEEVAARFAGKLPFLLKLLAANEPLSLQAHPSLEQARAGFAEEEAAGIPVNAPHRNYRDPNHKPELIVALTQFDALAGFRNPGKSADLLGLLRLAELEEFIAQLRSPQADSALRGVVTTWITLPHQRREALITAVLGAARARLELGEGAGDSALDPVTDRLVWETTVRLAELYPDDSGVLISLLLNRVRLEPGEGIYLGAGNLHAYLDGLGVEIMANSDNVLRGGLTPKHIDVPELLRIVNFNPLERPRVELTQIDEWSSVYQTPAPEFSLLTTQIPAAAALEVGSLGVPTIVLCTRGEVAGGGCRLRPGEAAWIAAQAPGHTLVASADSEVFIATVPAVPGAH